MNDHINGGFFRPPVTDEIAKKVGNFGIMWGELDFFLLLLINILSGLEWHEVEKIYGSDQTRSRMKRLLELFEDYRESFSEEVRMPIGLEKRFNKLSATRNALAHGVWMFVDSGQGQFPVCNHVGQKGNPPRK